MDDPTPLFPSLSSLIDAFNQKGVFAERIVREHCQSLARVVNAAALTNKLAPDDFRTMIEAARFLFVEDLLLDTFAVSAATLNRWASAETIPGELARLSIAQRLEQLMDDPRSPLPYNTTGKKPSP